MRMWRVCVVLGLLAGAAGARADWQPEPPPVPPDTEDAQRTRSESASSNDGAIQLPAGVDTAEDNSLASGHAAESTSQPLSANQPTATPPPGGAPPPAATATVRAPVDPHARTDADALRAFPPAPPPVVPGAAPEKPNTALTSFAPAPAPGPEGAPLRGASAAPAATSGSVGAPTEPPSEPAAASGEPAKEVWSAAALFGIGASFDNTIAGVNPMGFGFGVRADYRILPDWAIGARMLYFVGGSVELPSDDVAMQSWLLAAEAAYALELDPVSIEPGIALGLFVRETNYRGYPSFTDEPSFSVPDSTRLFFYLAPGVNVSVPLSIATPALAPLSIGADVRLDLAFGRRVTSNIQLLLQVGLRF